MNSKTANAVMVEMLPNQPCAQKPKANLMTRVLSALILAPIFLYLSYSGGIILHGLITVILTVALREWSKISTQSLFHPVCAFALTGFVMFHFTGVTFLTMFAGAMVCTLSCYLQKNTLSFDTPQRCGIFLAGVLYILMAMTFFIDLSTKNVFLSTQNTQPNSIHTHPTLFIIWLYSIVWSTDIGAYFTGSLLKGPKLCPRISPNKTWAGFFGGIIIALGIGYSFLTLLNITLITSISVFLIIVLFSVSAHSGDLIESAAKRYFKIKDAGQLIPGHGGVLDRLDSLFLVMIVAATLIYTNIIGIK